MRVPDGVDDAAVADYLLDEFDLEIAGGRGALSGEIRRIGCMGYSARPQNVTYLLTALGDALEAQRTTVDVEAGLAAAREGSGD